MYMTTKVKGSALHHERVPVFFIFNHLFYCYYVVRIITMAPSTSFIQLIQIFIKCEKYVHCPLLMSGSLHVLSLTVEMDGCCVGLMRSHHPVWNAFIFGLTWTIIWSKDFKETRTTIHTKVRVDPRNPSKKGVFLKTNVKACSQNLNRMANLKQPHMQLFVNQRIKIKKIKRKSCPFGFPGFLHTSQRPFLLAVLWQWNYVSHSKHSMVISNW